MTRYRIHDIEFRTIPTDEIDKFIAALQSRDPDAEEYIFNEITESKYDIKSLDAGTVLLVITLAIKKSGYARSVVDIADKIDSTAKELSNNILYSTFYSTILKAQPSVKLSELKQMSLNELLEYFCLSEIILTGSAGTILNTKKMREAAAKETQIKTSTGAGYVTNNELELLNKFLERDEFERQMG